MKESINFTLIQKKAKTKKGMKEIITLERGTKKRYTMNFLLYLSFSRCRNTGDVYTCPDGSYVDYSLARPGILDGAEGCKVEAFSKFPAYPKAVTKLL